MQRLIDQYPVVAKPDPLIEQLTDRLERESEAGTELALRMLKSLTPLSPDRTTIAAVLAISRRAKLADGPEPKRQPCDAGDESLEHQMTDQGVTALVEQFARVVRFDESYIPGSSERAEGLRRLILALIADVRVVLIVLAWQLSRMQLARDPQTRRALAREARAIHGPLANRLGIWQLKWQLEDLAFRYLEPENHARIERLLAEQRVERERHINAFIDQLDASLQKAGIAHEISGRAKHIYSIWRKMQRKGLDFHELFDVRAVRVLVDDLAACYAALGLVHSQWQPVPGEFDDYISNPKSNLYRSLHTAVRVPSGRVFEVQIRTHEMHEHAELGVAAHWRYKEGGPRDSALEQRIGVMRQLIEHSDARHDDGHDDRHDDQSLIEDFESLTSEDRVYALTPRGDVIDLAQGSTVLDFAYQVHTEVGHRCRGAKVNGRIVPLTHMLANGDRVEILTAKHPKPSRDWLNPQLGFLHSGRARGKVRHYFRQLNYDENLAAGRAAVESELKRLDLERPDLAAIAGDYHYQSVDDMLAGVGAGDLTAVQVAQAALRAQPGSAFAEPDISIRRVRETTPAASGSEVRIDGVGNLLYQLAQCCNPVPGDAIAGFITRSRGISIHREDCRQYLRLAQSQPERRIKVNWSERIRTRYPVRVRVDAWDRRELIKDIGAVLANQNLSVSGMQAGRGDQPEAVRIELSLEVGDLDQLSTLLGRLQAITNVTSVQRLR
ncbi:MAG: bifunctional (p)ppGpp synthetase/guanosine-3',5'-bis(diphosphate) 3'-pyrophosphohydrolase [Wenzhouxiangellaceae bacterium]|nr:bifunctional (p)ppGpp synthetase/guanosine-3',5'-bis(diphosphate) 3'-pyrophosphohydrolase [Wenzhouxiangellaceae bacterium]